MATAKKDKNVLRLRRTVVASLPVIIIPKPLKTISLRANRIYIRVSVDQILALQIDTAPF